MDPALLAMSMHCHGASSAGRSSLGSSPGILGWNCTLLPVLPGAAECGSAPCWDFGKGRKLERVECPAVLSCLCCLCVPWFPVALPLRWSMGVQCGWDIPVHGRSKARVAVLLLPSAQLSQALVKLCTQMAQVCHVSPLPQLVKATPFTQLEICPKRCPRLCSYLGDIPSSVRGMCGMRLEVLLS